MPTNAEVNRGRDSISKELVCTLFGKDAANFTGYAVLFLSNDPDADNLIEIASDAPGIAALNWILLRAAAAISDDLIELDERETLKQCGICKEMGHTSDEHV